MSDQETRRHDVPAPPPDDWRAAVCRRPADRARVDADAWNEVVRRRTESG